MTSCKLCGKEIPANEDTAYRGRCEDCWARDPRNNHTTTFGKHFDSASTYSSDIIGEAKEVTNTGPVYGGANRFFRRQRRNK